MEKAYKTVIFDNELHMEAYHFRGLAQPFPNHFHEYYVVGLVEDGQRILSCKNREYTIGKGSLLLFNPGDSHACVQAGQAPLEYRGLNISRGTMLTLSREVTGRETPPNFSRNVVRDEEAACRLHALHKMVMAGTEALEKEEALLFLLSMLIQNYSQPFESGVPECRREIEHACEFMAQHYAEPIRLEQLCRCTALSKSTLLRAFAKEKGVTPYRYLESLRISEAKKLLSQGVSPLDAALRTGFSDQSHFTKYFSRFIGLSPGVYRDIFCDKINENQEDTNGSAK